MRGSKHNFSRIAAAVVFAILVQALLPVHAQQPPASPSPSASAAVSPRPSGSPLPSGTTGNASTSPSPTMPPCNAAPGQFVVDSPRSNTLAQVSAPLNISWHYSDLTNKQRFPARKVSIFYQFADDNNPKAEWKLIADVNRTFTNYTWTVPSAQDGQYMVRLVADDFDLMQNPSLTCYPDTFPAASSSAKFKIMNSAPLANYPDTMGPSMGGAERNPVWLGIVAVAAILVFSVFEVWV